MDPQKSRYIARVVDEELDALLPVLDALSIEGPKAVGKTATAARRAVTAHALDKPGILSVLKADPTRLLSGQTPILIDEWQRMPESWDLVRRAVDENPAPGRFLLTGSSSTTAPTHTGAGRIVRVQMRPMTLFERGVANPTVSLRELLKGARKPIAGHIRVGLEEYVREILGSGFPGMRAVTERAQRAQLDGYLARIVDREFPDMGHPIRNPAGLRRWMNAYAAATATAASYETLRDAATGGQNEKPSKKSTVQYRDVLERLWIVDPLPAWLPSKNYFSRLSAGPKHHMADPALAARLLGADAMALLEARPTGPVIARDTTLLGQLFESLVALDVRVYAQAAEASVRHLRTHGGEREIDLIVERGDHRVLALEVKLAHSIAEGDVSHLRWLRDSMGDDLLDAVVVTTGTDAYRRPDGIAVVPAALLGP
jgi:predicted AAA+ superfamily ATPase